MCGEPRGGWLEGKNRPPPARRGGGLRGRGGGAPRAPPPPPHPPPPSSTARAAMPAPPREPGARARRAAWWAGAACALLLTATLLCLEDFRASVQQVAVVVVGADPAAAAAAPGGLAGAVRPPSAVRCQRLALPARFHNESQGPYNPAAVRHPATGEWLAVLTYDEARLLLFPLIITVKAHPIATRERRRGRDRAPRRPDLIGFERWCWGRI